VAPVVVAVDQVSEQHENNEVAGPGEIVGPDDEEGHEDEKTHTEEDDEADNEGDNEENSDKEEDSEEDDSEDEESVVFLPEAVSRAADWVQSALKIENLDSLWYERLGETHSEVYEYDAAITAFNAAKTLDNPSWQCFEGLALALAYSSNYEKESALPEMEKALEILRKIEAPTEQDHSSILQNLIRLADWEADLDKSEAAINHYEEALLMDPSSAEAQGKVIRLLLQIGHEERALELLNNMSKTKAKDADLSELAAIFQSLLLEDDSEAIFNMIFLVTSKHSLFANLLEDLSHAIEFARNEERTFDLVRLLLHKGVAIYHYDQREERFPESALDFWEEAGKYIRGV
jgi:tetratricopeptide (TPR) repeat protein